MNEYIAADTVKVLWPLVLLALIYVILCLRGPAWWRRDRWDREKREYQSRKH